MKTAPEQPAQLTATVRLSATEGHLLRRLKILVWFLSQIGLEPVGSIEIGATPDGNEAP